MMIKIYTSLAEKAQVLEQIKEIFFLTSSRKVFESPKAQADFFLKWTSYYFEQRPGFIYVAVEGSGDGVKTLGYITIEPDSAGALKAFETHPHYQSFASLYADFPAHLHINCHPSTQGKGVGSALIAKVEEDLKRLGIQGLHLITAPTARNVNFYRKNGFTFEQQNTLNDIHYLFMGKKL